VTDLDGRINEALEAQARRKQDEAESSKIAKETKERTNKEIEHFKLDVLRPALERVRQTLEGEGRDREVDIRDSGPNSITISVRSRGPAWPNPSELYVVFQLSEHHDQAFLESRVGVDDRWLDLREASGPLEKVTSERIFDTLMDKWIDNVKSGKH
jgi:hypothetical protein